MRVAIVALGKNWELPITGKVYPSFDTRINAEAAWALYSCGSYNYLIFSTGHTAGEMYPSEAQAMFDVLADYPIPQDTLILEEKSFDTCSNLKELSKLCQVYQIDRVVIISVPYHLPRIRLLAKRNLIVPYKILSSSKILNEHNQPFFYLQSLFSQPASNTKLGLRLLGSLSLEMLAWVTAIVDPHNKFSYKLTKKIRHQ